MGEEEENHDFMVCGTNFHVPKRYQYVKSVGQGAYGAVCAARDTVDGTMVAIKKIKHPFRNNIDAKRCLREIRLLRHFYHENIVTLITLLKPRSFAEFDELYLVSELVDTDLHQVIRSTQALTEDHIQYFLYQLARGLKFIHSAGVLHRDLKPSNLLVNRNCDLKICDFGLARVMRPESEASEDSTQEFMTEYVATRWYRAPEIMLCWKTYSQAIDIWSCGCIFAELLARRPLFPGKDYIHQLNLITDLLGTPDSSDLVDIQSNRARRFMERMPRKNAVPLAEKLPNASPLAIDLLSRMLTFNPAKRIDINGVLEHKYLASLHDANDEPTTEAPFDFDFENKTLSVEEYARLIYREVMHFHPGEGAAADVDMA